MGKEEQLVELLQRDYSVVFHTDAGRRVVRDLATYCRVLTSTAPDGTGPVDPIRMAILEGRRQVFNRINSVLELTPKQIMQIMPVHITSIGDDE